MLVYFWQRFFRLSAAQYAPPAGGQLTGGEFCRQTKKLCIKSKQAHFWLHRKFQRNYTGTKGIGGVFI